MNSTQSPNTYSFSEIILLGGSKVIVISVCTFRIKKPSEEGKRDYLSWLRANLAETC
jgi:hypothetical protein